MKQYILAVYDSKAEMFNQPMFFKAKGEGIRAFMDECNRDGSAIEKHPEDYTLFEIGQYNVETGLLVPLSTPVSMGLATDYKKENPQLPLDTRSPAEYLKDVKG